MILVGDSPRELMRINANEIEIYSHGLTTTEKSVLELAQQGVTDADIANELDCSPARVRNYLWQACKTAANAKRAAPNLTQDDLSFPLKWSVWMLPIGEMQQDLVRHDVQTVADIYRLHLLGASEWIKRVEQSGNKTATLSYTADELRRFTYNPEVLSTAFSYPDEKLSEIDRQLSQVCHLPRLDTENAQLLAYFHCLDNPAEIDLTPEENAALLTLAWSRLSTHQQVIQRLDCSFSEAETRVASGKKKLRTLL